MKDYKFGFLWLMLLFFAPNQIITIKSRILIEIDTQIWTFAMGECHLYHPEQLLEWAKTRQSAEGQSDTMDSAEGKEGEASTPDKDDGLGDQKTKYQSLQTESVAGNLIEKPEFKNADPNVVNSGGDANEIGSHGLDSPEDLGSDPQRPTDSQGNNTQNGRRQLHQKLMSDKALYRIGLKTFDIEATPMRALKDTEKKHVEPRELKLKKTVEDSLPLKKIQLPLENINKQTGTKTLKLTGPVELTISLPSNHRRSRVLEETDPRLEVESPEIIIKEVNPATGKYEEVGDYGLKELKYYDENTTELEDVDTEIDFGFEIADYFWDKGRISLESETIVKSMFTWNMFKGINVKGTTNIYNLYDRTGPDKKMVLQVECFNHLVHTEKYNFDVTPNKSNSQGYFVALSWAVGFFVLLI